MWSTDHNPKSFKKKKKNSPLTGSSKPTDIGTIHSLKGECAAVAKLGITGQKSYIHTRNIIGTEEVAFIFLEIYVYMKQQLKKERSWILERAKGGVRGVGGAEGKGEIM